jgi:hypothetical protein
MLAHGGVGRYWTTLGARCQWASGLHSGSIRELFQFGHGVPDGPAKFAEYWAGPFEPPILECVGRHPQELCGVVLVNMAFVHFHWLHNAFPI